MPAKKLPRCECCGRAFRPDAYNEDRQKYCTRSDCVLERKRERNRKYYQNKYHNDEQFRTSEIARATAGRKRRPAGKNARPPPELGVDIHACMIGLIAQHTALNDPVLISEAMHKYAARGQRLALNVSESRKRLI